MGTYVIPESDPDNPGMSLERFQEIADAEENGTPLDLTPEERAEYEEHVETVRQLAKQAAALVKGPKIKPSAWGALNNGPLAKIQADMAQSKLEQDAWWERRRRERAESEAQMQAALEDVTEAARQREERERLRTDALQALVDSSLSQGRFNWWLLSIGALTLLATIAGVILAGISLASSASDLPAVSPSPQATVSAPAKAGSRN
ncbi:hypothetical protein LVY72_22595 [Arthrobacter sp. I2-34]|uniref:Uncharacterized protein n=1 Tax=Arthrobacter hankyongi TaxID=2904801 RepID=A0ABS9LDC5_9MICC|nr:hypothetical protein [Arthrobacter hankyongi]MCG2624683.1 hypothetical protein [Arthrobacter hankyongi]